MTEIYNKEGGQKDVTSLEGTTLKNTFNLIHNAGVFT